MLYDCAIIGGGPAGLAAATYLGRFRRRILVIEDGQSRASYIPNTLNTPGYVNGVSGIELLKELKLQSDRYIAKHTYQKVHQIRPENEGFCLTSVSGDRFWARKVLLATGVKDHLPSCLMQPKRAIQSGKVKLCPVCDAYELTGQPIFIVGYSDKAAREALFLRNYSNRLTLFLEEPLTKKMSKSLQRSLKDAEIRWIKQPVSRIEAMSQGVIVTTNDFTYYGTALYVALGVTISSSLATCLGARTSKEGYLLTNRHQETNIKGLYAAGDVVQSLSQIAVAFGQAALAASAIHQSLKRRYYPTIS